jgi:hypothetical protein
LHAFSGEAIGGDFLDVGEPNKAGVTAIEAGVVKIRLGANFVLITTSDLAEAGWCEVVIKKDFFDKGPGFYRTRSLLEVNRFTGGGTLERGTGDACKATFQGFLAGDDKVEIMRF